MLEPSPWKQSALTRTRHSDHYFARALVIPLCIAFIDLACGQSDPRVGDFLATVNKSIIDIAGQAEPQASAICHRTIASVMNMDAIVRDALAGLRSSMSPRQRAAYRDAAGRWAVRDCVRRNRDNQGVPLEFVGIRDGDSGERILATRSTQPAHTALWRLHGGRRLQAVDVVIDGRSMMLSLRDETNSLLGRNNGDMDKAIDALGR